MTLQQLRYIVAIAETRSITAAAARLFISQPSLTNAVRRLEEEMNLTLFVRSSRGVEPSSEGKTFLSYARQVLEQANLLEEKYKNTQKQSPRFSVSCQHYSFAVEAFVDVIRRFDASDYDFTLRETQTHEIIEDVSRLTSEIGVLYLSSRNEEIIRKLLHRNRLRFQLLFEARPHVFLRRGHPLAGREQIRLEELQSYPYFSFEQGEYNSFYFSEEILSAADSPKNIKVRDRATLFSLLIGLDGYTVSSGVIRETLDGPGIIARPLVSDEIMRIGAVTQKDMILSRYGKCYLEALHAHIKKPDT